MSSILRKSYAAFTCLLITSAIQLNGNTCAPRKPSCCEPERSNCPSPCCGPKCLPSIYSGPHCIPAPYCDELNVWGELLFWTAQLGGLETAFGTTTIATSVARGITTTTITETDKDPAWHWKPGYRVGADYAFGCFIVEAYWTHYNGLATFHEEGQHGHWSIKYNTLDLIFGRRLNVAPCFYFLPFIGVRGLLAHQNLESHLNTYFTALAGNSTVTTVKNDTEHTWGIGPELGVEANWYLGCKWSIYGSFDVVSYYGHTETKIHNTDTFTATVSTSDGINKRCFNAIGTDASLGIRWDQAWPVASEVLLTIKLGVEQHRIYDFSDLGSDGTLSLDGANLALSVGYRF